MHRGPLPVYVLGVLLTTLAVAGDAPAPATLASPDLTTKEPYARVLVAPTKTSIYVGNVSLTLVPLTRHGAAYTSEYRAKVFPFFFYGEDGRFSIEFPDESLRRLLQGEVVTFKGHALNRGGEGRRIEGRALPDGSGADHGKIKIRVWVGKIELIFNSTYQFAGPG